MSQDERGGGTNADGTKSAEYCSHCMRGGTWMLDMSVDQMQERVGGMLKRKGIPEGIRKQAVAHIPSLKRWNIQ